MKIVLSIFSSMLVLLGIIYSGDNSQENQMSSVTEFSDSQEDAQVENKDVSVSVNILGDNSQEAQENTKIDSSTNDNLSSYVYPNAKIISSNSFSLTLQSSNDPTMITDWYKDKIISEGMNVKSFVETKANNKILNKLAGANNTNQITIEITRDSGESQTNINVQLN